jgi:hypothetical protein
MNLSENHNIYFGKRDVFYCVEIADKSVVRDNQLCNECMTFISE